MSFLTALFQKPKVPNIQAPPPPQPPPQNAAFQAEMAQAGRQQGLLATLFGYRSPSGGSPGGGTTGGGGHNLTGQ